MVQNGKLVKATIPLPGGETAVYNASGLNFIRHKDWLGSSRLATTWTHGFYAKEAYAPFGESYNEAGTPDRSFTGQDQDTVPGVYDYLFRKYDPAAGRWLSPDPSGWKAVSQSYPQSLNRYAYVQNNPLSLIDADGLDCVYFNNDGNSVESIDQNSNESECGTNGGDWVEGNTTISWIGYDENTDVFNIGSIDEDQQTVYFTQANAPDASFFGCSGNCASDPSEMDFDSLLSQLSPTGKSVGDLLNWMSSQKSVAGPGTMGPTPWWAQLATGTNWAGPGGYGIPTGTDDWAAVAHDFQYAATHNTYPNPSDPNYPGGPQLQQINQQLCNNVGDGTPLYLMTRVIFNGTWGCR